MTNKYYNAEHAERVKMQVDLWGNEIIPDVLLRDKFIEPPFSVLDTKSGNWQNRKREWIRKGIKSEIGRCDTDNFVKTMERGEYWQKKMGAASMEKNQGTSIFDPALCELMYKWFCNDGGKILDPFAGGSVRGIVAHYLKYYYVGIELRQEQVDANRENAAEILPVNNQPSWHVGDSDSILDNDFLYEFDMIFSCPPYMDLEVYSDDENDLSNMTDEKFIEKYKSIIKKSCSKLKKDGYAVFVVGDVRDKKTGFYKDFIGITKQAFYDAGMSLYNDAILLNPVASASMRADRIFTSGKKLVKIHQNILVFKRGKDTPRHKSPCHITTALTKVNEMKKQESTKQFTESSERAFRIGIRKKLDAMVKDESVLKATAELLLAEAE